MKKWGYGFLCLLLLTIIYPAVWSQQPPSDSTSRKRCRQMDSLLQRSQWQYIGKIS